MRISQNMTLSLSAFFLIMTSNGNFWHGTPRIYKSPTIYAVWNDLSCHKVEKIMKKFSNDYSLKHLTHTALSSPDLKVPGSFSDHLSSVCLSVHLSSVCKLFTFSSSSLTPLCQFRPNLARSILGWREIKFV